MRSSYIIRLSLNSVNYCKLLRSSLSIVPRYGRGVGPIQLSSASCVGFEGSLFDCPLTLGDGEGVCSHDMDVGIECGRSSIECKVKGQ